MSGRGRLSVILGALAGIWLAAAILQARERNYPLEPVPERLLYLRSGKAADRLMLTFDALAADVYWIRSIQSYGRDLKDRSRRDRFALLQSLLDLTTTLDDHFLIAYRFGAVFLSLSPPEGPGRPDQAIALLEKGLAADPSHLQRDLWWLAHDIAFVHLFHTRHYEEAAQWFERAAAMPGAAPWLHEMAALTKAQGGNRQAARQILTAMLDSPETYIRNSSRRMVEQLDALDLVDAMQKIVDGFHAANGRFPSGWPELIEARLISAIPSDPERAPLWYDVATGRVMLSPNSPLMPLPEGLKTK